MAKILGRALEDARGICKLKGIKPISGVDNMVHRYFMDDNILLGKATIVETKAIKKELVRFEDATD